MGGASVRLVQADGESLSYVEGLLERNELPSEDVRSKPECFYLGYVRDESVGIGGIEIDGTDGLLRSVVVDRSKRGAGFGTAICDALEDRALEEGVEALYLLTTTAADFFAGRGYGEIERTDAPGPIRETTEWSDLCPATATCMTKSL